jgi:hypothetical protein
LAVPDFLCSLQRAAQTLPLPWRLFVTPPPLQDNFRFSFYTTSLMFENNMDKTLRMSKFVHITIAYTCASQLHMWSWQCQVWGTQSHLSLATGNTLITSFESMPSKIIHDNN